jgi:hypothetical protein
MTILLLLPAAAAVLAAIDALAHFAGAEDRPGFDERKPLS